MTSNQTESTKLSHGNVKPSRRKTPEVDNVIMEFVRPRSSHWHQLKNTLGTTLTRVLKTAFRHP